MPVGACATPAHPEAANSPSPATNNAFTRTIGSLLKVALLSERPVGRARANRLRGDGAACERAGTDERMNARARARSALALSLATAALAGCTLGPSPFARDERFGREPLSAKTLLYISDWATNEVFVYDYDSRAQIGKLDGFKQPSGECVDSKNDVWITDFRASDVLKFGHGGSKPIETLQTTGHPIGCAVDFTS